MQIHKMHASNVVETFMAMLTVRNLPDEVHRALRLRAAQHGCSTEAEVRKILLEAVQPSGRMHMGDALWDAARRAGVSDADVEALLQTRDRSPAQPMALP
jgi:antitoxin FitA